MLYTALVFLLIHGRNEESTKRGEKHERKSIRYHVYFYTYDLANKRENAENKYNPGIFY